MTITREQVAELRPGDVVELHDDRWPEASVIRGPVYISSLAGVEGDLCVAGSILRTSEGLSVQPQNRTLTVVSRAPRPLYVNHDRTEPVAGDVVRIEWQDASDDNYVNAYMPRRVGDPEPWVSLGTGGHGDAGERYTGDQSLPNISHKAVVRLLVDGATGQVVQP